MQQQVSADDIARYMAVSPSRARNEVRRACRHAFEQDEWLGVGESMRAELVNQVLDSVFGFGPLEDLLADSSVTEVMVNGPYSVFFERNGKLYPSNKRFENDAQLRALIDRILGPLGRRVDESSPLVNARLDEGHRVNIVIPPLSLDGPVVTIRKFTDRVLRLDDLMLMGSFDAPMRQFLVWLVRLRKNVAVSGGTGSGKTTLLNALSCEISPDERIITIEDSAELRFLEHPHVVRLEARPRNAEGRGEVTIRDLVTNALRMRPDRIVVGECRGAEALDMLQAMNTGHDGSLTTCHANNPAEVITRLTTMVRYAADLPVDVVEANIASALDVVVQTARGVDGQRYVSHIAEIGYDAATRSCQVSLLFEWDTRARVGRWLARPAWLSDVVAFGLAGERGVQQWLQDTYLAQ
ncbi:MAG: CpaF family protein [Coriobacteriia bacterium]|nr:CpaF family protein [Coriobacteriia bacterium]